NRRAPKRKALKPTTASPIKRTTIMSTPELGSSRTQPLNPKVSARPDQDWRDLCAIRREHVREERFRRADSQWRKRCAAITSGRFRGADGFTDEKALDAYAPHETDG